MKYANVYPPISGPRIPDKLPMLASAPWIVPCSLGCTDLVMIACTDGPAMPPIAAATITA